VEKAVPARAEEVRKADPSAKYYATEGFNAGGDTPAQMNCESPSGEKAGLLPEQWQADVDLIPFGVLSAIE
jgi:hypothetical protein